MLFNIPDGHQKEMPTSGSKHKETVGSAKEVNFTFYTYCTYISIAFELGEILAVSTVCFWSGQVSCATSSRAVFPEVSRIVNLQFLQELELG